MDQSDRPLGRDTEATIKTKKHWETLIPQAPRHFAGAGDAQESPPIWLYCPGGFQNQLIGMCVGCGTANGVGTMLRIPEGCKFDPVNPANSTKPLPTRAMSALFCYFNARNVHGMSSFGEGAVVAYSMDALMTYGVAPQDLYPDSYPNQQAYSDRRKPPQAAYDEGRRHVVVHAARITSRAMYFDYLAQGYPIIDGVPIGQGWMQTAEDGRFSLGGRNVGGHCTLTVGYSRTKNRLFKRNSWVGWGAVTSDPEFQGQAQGRNNVGYCDLDQFEDAYLSPSSFDSGETDAFVISDVPGFDKPKMTPISAVELFT